MRIGDTRPYPPTGLTRETWQRIMPEWIDYHCLTTTQKGVYIDAVLQYWPSPESDAYPNVVAYQGRFYLEDGHTRIVRDLLAGFNAGWVRVLRLSI